MEDEQLFENPRHLQSAGGASGYCSMCILPRQPRWSGRLGNGEAAAGTRLGAERAADALPSESIAAFTTVDPLGL